MSLIEDTAAASDSSWDGITDDTIMDRKAAVTLGVCAMRKKVSHA